MSDTEFTEERINRDLLGPLFKTSGTYYLVVALLAMVALVVFVAWGRQLMYGIGMAGKNRPSFWGLYITTFVFWIGISHAGTLISAILRLVNAGWRRPVTRCAEVITAFALMIGGLFPIIHLGKPWLFRQCAAALRGEPIPPDPTLEEERRLLHHHYRLVCQRFGPERGTSLMRKFACCYAQGRRGAQDFRAHVARVSAPAEFTEAVESHFPRT
jgi:hypothetical protein